MYHWDDLSHVEHRPDLYLFSEFWIETNFKLAISWDFLFCFVSNDTASI